MSYINMTGVKNVCQKTLLNTSKNKINLATEMRVLGPNAGVSGQISALWKGSVCNVKSSVNKGGLANNLYTDIANGKSINGVHYNKNQKGEIWVSNATVAGRIDLVAKTFEYVCKNKGKTVSIDGKKVTLFHIPHRDTEAFGNAVLMYARYGTAKVDAIFQLGNAADKRANQMNDQGMDIFYHRIRTWYDGQLSRLHKNMQKHIATGGAGGQHVPFGLGSADRFRGAKSK